MIGQFKAYFYSDDIHINTVNCYFLNVSIVPTIRNCDVISILIPLNYGCLLTNKSFNASCAITPNSRVDHTFYITA